MALEPASTKTRKLAFCIGFLSRNVIVQFTRLVGRRVRSPQMWCWRRMVWLTLFVFLMSGLSEGCAMGMFDRLVLFSEVHGTVLKDDKPVTGAELVQHVRWSDDESKNPTQRVVTDEKGGFRFPAIKRRAGVLRLLPAQPMMLQTIMIHYQGVEYIGWRYGKDSFDDNSELEGRSLNLVCELTREPSHEGTHYGVCKVV